MSDTMTPTDKLMTVDMLEAIAREVGQMERRHCIGKAQGFDIRDGYAELHAAIEQYGKEQYARGVNDAWPAGRGSGEPVAHMWQHPETGLTGFVEHAPKDELQHWERMNKPRKIVMPLYTAPQSREPLTDEQALELATQEFPYWREDIQTAFVLQLTRAIERAHGIRSEG